MSNEEINRHWMSPCRYDYKKFPFASDCCPITKLVKNNTNQIAETKHWPYFETKRKYLEKMEKKLEK